MNTQDIPAELAALSNVDPAILDLILIEQERQADTLEMIASENHTSRAVMAATGSCLTNKYCEGYPGRRYYNGCGNYDQIEQLAIDRACELFGCSYANVQPHSGASANLAVQFALLEPGDTFAAIELSEGGHLTHGSPVNLSGKWLNPVTYKLIEDEADPNYGAIDMESVEAVVAEHKPKLIMCGYSAHPKAIDFAGFKAIADKHGCLLWCDMAHIAGLVAGGAHESPFPYCDVVTTTTHKTLRGPRGGLILANDEELGKKFNRAVFPGTQGGPLMHSVAAKAICFGEALKPEFKTYAEQTVNNAKALAEALKAKGFKLAANGTDNHLVLVDLRPLFPELTGKEAAIWLEDAGVITNMNTVPKETRSPFKTSGVRLGTPALTTRGLKEADMSEVADIIYGALQSNGDATKLVELNAQSKRLAQRFPMPH